MIDEPVAIDGVTGCRHVFGSACLLQLFWAHPSNPEWFEYPLRCPLCRQLWIVNLPPMTYCDNQPPEMRDSETRVKAQIARIDYATARYALYEEEEYEAQHQPMALDEFKETIHFWQIVLDAIMERPWVHKYCLLVQSRNLVSESDMGYIPPGTFHDREPFNTADPFSFRNFYAWHLDIARAVFEALTSTRGERFQHIYKEEALKFATAVIAEETPPAGTGVVKMYEALPEGNPEEAAFVSRVANRWMALFPDDVEDFVILILKTVVSFSEVNVEDGQIYLFDSSDGIT